MGDLRLFPGIFTASAPAGIRRFSTHVCQNVVGLWLKYGAKSLKIRASLRCEILLHDTTIC